MDPEFLQFRLGSGDAIGALAYPLVADRGEYDVLHGKAPSLLGREPIYFLFIIPRSTNVVAVVRVPW